ncbi:hypothetical protein [Streptomyces adelaidensis]|uniref:hypothetical protein n=1 Tax=Streptomyces adelaidensis TaxID=2796465 RepID=UPI001905AA0A|nr:hypothetical protein [Streptomyces adelaidensis]
MTRFLIPQELLQIAQTLPGDPACLDRSSRSDSTWPAATTLWREDAAVLVHLLSLADLAPEDLSRRPLARDMVQDLQQRVRPTFRRQVDALADRLQLA